MKKTVQLFQCPNETQVLPTEGWIPPFGSAYIATYAKQQGHNVSLCSTVNGMSLLEMLAVAGNADVVGVTTTASTYHSALMIARAAKLRNPDVLVVLGGPEAAVLSEEVLLNRGILSADPCVDIVCHGDGVISFDSILNDNPLETIPNLAFIKDGKRVKTERIREDIGKWPCIDFSFFNMERVTSVYGEKFQGITPFKRGLGVMSGFGCAAKHQCGFCARTDRTLRLRPAEKFWQEIDEASKSYGVEYFFDLADSILDSPDHLRELIGTRPKDLSPKFRVFARADQLSNKGNLDLLQQLGVYEVFIGFESGSKKILEAMHKDTTPEQNLSAAKAVGERGIYIVGCFVLGAPGETVQTLTETMYHVEAIQRASNNHLLVCGASPVNVLPGSPWFSRIKNEKGIKGVDDLDRNFLREIWYSKFCPDMTLDLVEEYAQKIRESSGAMMQYEKGTDKK